MSSIYHDWRDYGERYINKGGAKGFWKEGDRMMSEKIAELIVTILVCSMIIVFLSLTVLVILIIIEHLKDLKDK